TQAAPGYLTAGRSVSNFVNFQIQSRTFHGLTLLGSYNIRKTLVNNTGKDMRSRITPNLQNPNDLNEFYGVALYEYPQNVLLNYYYELPFGRGKRFMNTVHGWGGRLVDAAAGGWILAGVTNWWPHGTPVLGPRVSGSQSAPGAVVRWSVSGPNYKNANVDYSSSLVVSGAYVNSNPSAVFNRSAFVRTPDFGFGNVPFVFPNVRNPGGINSDMTVMKNFYISENRQ